HRRSGCGWRGICRRAAVDLYGWRRRNMVDGVDDVALDGGEQVFEHLMAFPLVGHQWIALTNRPQTDALAHLFHRSEVLHPVRIDRPQHYHALQEAGKLRAELGLALCVERLGGLQERR